MKYSKLSLIFKTRAWFNLYLLTGEMCRDWCPAARFLTKSVSGTNCGLSQWDSPDSPGPWDPGHSGARAGARGEVTRSCHHLRCWPRWPHWLWLLRKYDLWQVPGRPNVSRPITWTRPLGGGRGLWLNSSYGRQNELCQVCKTEIPHSPQRLNGVPDNWLVDNYGSYKDYPRFIWIKTGISG